MMPHGLNWERKLSAMSEQVQQVIELHENVDAFASLICFARDRDLVSQGYAPTGWVQPTIEEYEMELGERPSLLPYENFLRAVVDGKVPMADADRYATWVESQKSAISAD